MIFGGGKMYLVPKEKGGNRDDGQDLIEVLRSRGYGFVEVRDEMLKTDAQKSLKPRSNSKGGSRGPHQRRRVRKADE